MADPFLAEIRIVGFSFAPVGWATCDGQLLPISQNTALFSLLGTNFGGDGRSTFALPNFRDSTSMSQGQGPGLTPRVVGESGGVANITLLNSEMPAHSHGLQARPVPGNATTPGTTTSLAQSNPASNRFYKQTPFGTPTLMNVQSVSIAGGSVPHNNLQPYLALLYIIALQGIYPQRP